MRCLMVLFLWVMACVSSFAEEEDFQTWYNFSLVGELCKNVQFALEPELRLFDNSRELRSWQTELDVCWSILKRVAVGGVFRYQVKYDNPEYHQRVNRWSMYTKVNYKAGKFKWSYKVQVQSQYTNRYSSSDGGIPKVGHKHRLAFKYAKKKLFAHPSIALEYYFGMVAGQNSGKGMYRYQIALERKFSKRSNGKVIYRRQRNFGENTLDVKNVILLGVEYHPKFLKR